MNTDTYNNSPEQEKKMKNSEGLHTGAGTAENKTDREARTLMLRDYIKRLSQGESLETVRKDFIAHFSEAEPFEIMQAEQMLIREGMNYRDVQKLCDVHSALFHGATREEKIANAEKAVQKSLASASDAGAAKPDNDINPEKIRTDKLSAFRKLADIPGHPLNLFRSENEAIEDVIDQIQNLLTEATGDDGTFTTNPADAWKLRENVNLLRKAAIHYAKKGDLLYPHLNARYNISGPSKVMWGVDDEIRDELRKLCEKLTPADDLNDVTVDSSTAERLKKVTTRMKEMIYKENNILFPICAKFFSREDWIGIYRDSKDYGLCLVRELPLWKEGEEAKESGPDQSAEISLPSGHFTLEQLRAVLNTLPVEISFVDENNINCYFNEGHKLFKRPLNAIGREVFTCHPPKVEAMVRAIIEEFRAGTKDSIPVWMTKEGVPVLVTYTAVRDNSGRYLGTLECVQKMDAAEQHFTKQH